MTIELLVRPFQTTSPAIALPSGAPQTQSGPVILRIVTTGVARTFSGSYKQTTTVYVKKYPTEVDTPAEEA